MAHYQVTNNTEYLCDSESDKENITPVGVGAKVLVLDSGQKYIWNGARWVEDLILYAAFRAALEDAT
jgi:hypothetical protein